MTTATVETLTAEVRVLMVGNRQVTLSVYRQLDVLPLHEVDPFGRVRDGKDAGVWVVGRARSSGVLVRAGVEPVPYATVIVEDDLTDKVILCNSLFQGHAEPFLTFRERRGQFAKGAYRCCGDRSHFRGQSCGGWNPNGLEEEISAALDDEEARLAPHKAAVDLPLIVLAGLR